MANNPGISRRLFVGAGLAAAAAFGAMPAWAFTTEQAQTLIGKVVNDINGAIAAGGSDAKIIASFEKLFAQYADVPTIAISALGPAGRSASDAQKAAFTKAFQGYLARKYGRRFREFNGGRIEVLEARPVKSYFEVTSKAHLPGKGPFDVRWHVSERGGRQKFFNIIIEGVNMLSSERTEIGAMLDKRKGNIDALIADLAKA